ncbi:AraC family transcriptional regulator [Cellulosilyticum ruminicola]|uniref:AraC family transcriptional regulator n=1 Tax=Cellulosilyticum ruminicola TaxID=425254 RepID=UPI0006CFE8E9|nr:AraC family transcriptional regulator [Cellulosilyticum ruminicola]
MFQMQLNFFTKDTSFPFMIQYGFHEENLYLHSHGDFLEITFVLNGSATHIVNEESFYISKGDVFIIGSDTYHGYKNPKDFKICNLMFQPDFFFKSDYDIKKAPGYQGLFIIEPILFQKGGFQSHFKLSPTDYETVHRMITLMIAEYEAQNIGFKTLVTGYFYSLTVLLSRLYTTTNSVKSTDVMSMARAIAYMESSYTEDIHLEALAKLAGFSTRHFSRRFYEIKSTTPMHYIQMLRLEKAANYLKTSDLSISDIALTCGFSDSNYFSRLFKKHYGLSPSHFYQMHHSHLLS